LQIRRGIFLDGGPTGTPDTLQAVVVVVATVGMETILDATTIVIVLAWMLDRRGRDQTGLFVLLHKGSKFRR
jgi:hypothetical protein